MQLKNEQINADMVDIMDKLQTYVPKKFVQRGYENESEGITRTFIKVHMIPVLLGGTGIS